MSPWDAIVHLANFLLPALALALFAAAGAKLLWHSELKGVRWLRLWAWPAAAGVLALLAGLVMGGGDGRMSTYAAMVLASAAGLWWAGWGSSRR